MKTPDSDVRSKDQKLGGGDVGCERHNITNCDMCSTENQRSPLPAGERVGADRPATEVRPSNLKLQTRLREIAESLLCREGSGHYCPNCGNTTFDAAMSLKLLADQIGAPVETTHDHARAVDLLQANIHERDRRLRESHDLIRRIWVHVYSRAGLRVRDKYGHLYDDVEKTIREIGMGRTQLEEITPEEPESTQPPDSRGDAALWVLAWLALKGGVGSDVHDVIDAVMEGRAEMRPNNKLHIEPRIAEKSEEPELCPRCQQSMPGGVALHTDHCPQVNGDAPQ